MRGPRPPTAPERPCDLDVAAPSARAPEGTGGDVVGPGRQPPSCLPRGRRPAPSAAEHPRPPRSPGRRAPRPTRRPPDRASRRGRRRARHRTRRTPRSAGRGSGPRIARPRADRPVRDHRAAGSTGARMNAVDGCRRRSARFSGAPPGPPALRGVRRMTNADPEADGSGPRRIDPSSKDVLDDPRLRRTARITRTGRIRVRRPVPPPASRPPSAVPDRCRTASAAGRARPPAAIRPASARPRPAPPTRAPPAPRSGACAYRRPPGERHVRSVRAGRRARPSTRRRGDGPVGREPRRAGPGRRGRPVDGAPPDAMRPNARGPTLAAPRSIPGAERSALGIPRAALGAWARHSACVARHSVLAARRSTLGPRRLRLDMRCSTPRARLSWLGFRGSAFGTRRSGPGD